eukprot:gnl/TRDRNA2_/TRDRNA2_90163_c0_seq1.p1 gnl/TRDRNA2_/TRDRNA2_90163_c0~~gnl/TRDRNA2_/TRDRNA2_90163_c0_seq1.p1  ORF type:complete len:404 (-),score=60.46 gnl/TRDRNA2_/TRDRNA2_90163_c0_seq1:8-1219(-)
MSGSEAGWRRVSPKCGQVRSPAYRPQSARRAAVKHRSGNDAKNIRPTSATGVPGSRRGQSQNGYAIEQPAGQRLWRQALSLSQATASMPESMPPAMPSPLQCEHIFPEQSATPGLAPSISKTPGSCQADYVKAALQARLLEIKAELHDGKADLGLSHQKLNLLEGDVQGKEQWQLHWDRRIADRNTPCALTSGSGVDNGNLAGLSWNAWSEFLHRGVNESRKVARHLSRALDVGRLEIEHSDLQEETRMTAKELHVAEASLAEEHMTAVQLAGSLRRQEAVISAGGRHAVTESHLRQELAMRQEAVPRRVRHEEEAYVRRAEALTTELEEARLRLQQSFAHQQQQQIDLVRSEHRELLTRLRLEEDTTENEDSRELESELHQQVSALKSEISLAEAAAEALSV